LRHHNQPLHTPTEQTGPLDISSPKCYNSLPQFVQLPYTPSNFKI